MPLHCTVWVASQLETKVPQPTFPLTHTPKLTVNKPMVEVLLQEPQIPQCPKCGEKIMVRLNNEKRNQWKCKICGKYFIFPQRKKACLTCQKEFTPKYNQKYCSESCIPKPISQVKIKSCPICGKEFQKPSKYCSIECNLKQVEIRKQEAKEATRLRRLKMPTKSCLWCHGSFKNFFSITKFCCYLCGDSYRKMTRQIYQAYPFDRVREQQELFKLKEQGKFYQLPRDSE